MSALLLVVANAGTPTANDLYYEGILEGLGHSVTFRSDEDADDVTGFDGVVVAESVTGATISTKYATAAVPVVTHEGAHVFGLGMTSGAGNSNETVATTEVLEDTHPMMDGPYGSFTGTITIFTGAVSVAYIDYNVVTLEPGVTAITDSPSATDWAPALGAEGGAFPALRAFIWPSTGASVPALTADGENALKNTYFWAFGLGGIATVAWLTA